MHWLVGHLAPERTLMLDDGAGLAASDRATLERHAVGGASFLHYRLRDATQPPDRIAFGPALGLGSSGVRITWQALE